MEEKSKKKGKVKTYYEKIDRRGKRSFIIYIVLRIIVVICGILELIRGNYVNAFLCLITLLLFTIPTMLEETLKIEFPSMMESIIYFFTFAAEILGEINNFYEIIPFWDSMLHAINGFISAGLGFVMIDILNNNSKKLNLSPMYIAIFAFCFSMTIGVFWEFFEYSQDRIFRFDMQKDTIIENVSSFTIGKDEYNFPTKIDDIKETIIVTESGDVYTIPGYLDIGLRDTMDDLLVNFIGATIFSVLGFFYVYRREEMPFLQNFIPRKRKVLRKH